MEITYNHVYIIVIAGVYGGIVSYLLSYNAQNIQNNEYRFKYKIKCVLFGCIVFKYIIIGLAGASLVPLFLKIISSTTSSGQFIPDDYGVFFGYCLISAIFAEKVIAILSDRFFKMLEETKQKVEETKYNIKQVEINVENISGKVNNAQERSKESLNKVIEAYSEINFIKEKIYSLEKNYEIISSHKIIEEHFLKDIEDYSPKDLKVSITGIPDIMKESAESIAKEYITK